MPDAILLTRPAGQCAASAARLQTLGFRVIYTSMTEIHPLPEGIGLLRGMTPQAVLLTSANALPALHEAGISRDIPLFVVGEATATAAREAGWTVRHDAGSDARALYASIPSFLQPDDGLLLHPCGRDLAEAANIAGFTVRHIPVYVAERVAALPQEAVRALREEAPRVLLYSARAAQAFEALAGEAALARAEALCLSPRIAQTLRASWRTIRVAPAPNEASLFALLEG